MRYVTIALSILVGGALAAASALAATTEHHLTIARQKVNFTGMQRPAMTINGTIPGPVLHFREGDDALIHVHNAMDVETSIHWHGILLPNDQDGVPYLTFPPIAPGRTFTYRFPIRQSGTYWYHSHSGLQDQQGVYGAIVITPATAPPTGGRDVVVLLSDWSDEDPHTIMRTLKRGSPWYGIRKGSAQSLVGAAAAGRTGAFFHRELSRMPPMDISDVAYDAFLANGQQTLRIDAAANETLRFRIVDGSATTYFYLEFAAGPMTVVAADGVDVQPFAVQRLLIGVAETYDLLIQVPADGSHELRATAHDGTGYASVWIGEGTPHPAPVVPRSDLYAPMGEVTLSSLFSPTPEGAMGMSDDQVAAGFFDRPGMNMPGHAGHAMHAGTQGSHPAGHATHGGVHAAHPSGDTAVDGMDPRRPWPPYAQLRALQPTAYPAAKPRREIRLTLDGDMERYVWSFNNRALHEADRIRVREGDVARFILINRTMMHHPIHLHGHFFRVVNGQGDHAPLKHTVDVAPMTTTVIEFDADAPGDWFFHCHLLYHMHSGMARVIDYEEVEPPPEVAAIQPRLLEDPWYASGEVHLMSHMTEGAVGLSDTRHRIAAGWQAGWRRVEGTEYEVELTVDRFLTPYVSLFAGADLTNEAPGDRAILGARYTLPLLIHATGWIDSDGEVRVGLEKDLPLTDRLHLYGRVRYDTAVQWEGEAGLRFIAGKHVSIVAGYHDTYGVGAGLGVSF